ncbi:tRNA dihydrouridine synthase DusB [bacterium]|nr:tRNA dihydrouridine synthase DusB [candidate division CSSED10-310 bacterium]
MKPFVHQLFIEQSPAVLSAPLAGVTDAAYQRILFECGAPVVSTEMIPSAALALHPAAATKILQWQHQVHPINAQVYGTCPEQIATTLRLIEPYRPDTIDINMGCPARKIVRNGSGLALMNDLPRATKILRAARQATDGPLSIKIRLGIIPGEMSAVAFAQMAESEGADFITVHGRYRTSYSVPADWAGIAAVKAAVSIPVIGNGDIFSAEDARRLLDQTGCNGVMIARGILGDPWLPYRVHRFLRTGILPPEPTLAERFRVFSRHMDYLFELKGERRAGFIFRKHAAWYLKGFPNIVHFRRQLFTISRPEQFYGIVKDILESYRRVAID